MDVDLHKEWLEYFSHTGKYTKELQDWILPKKKGDGSYTEMIMRAKGLWQDKK